MKVPHNPLTRQLLKDENFEDIVPYCGPVCQFLVNLIQRQIGGEGVVNVSYLLRMRQNIVIHHPSLSITDPDDTCKGWVRRRRPYSGGK